MASDDQMEVDVKIESEESASTEDPHAVLDTETDLSRFYNYQSKKLLEKTHDIQEKLVTARHVLHACKREKTHEPVGTHLTKLHYYTDQPLQLLKDLLKDDKHGNRSLKQVIMDTKTIPATVIPFIYSDIREIFIEFYVKTKQLPTTMEFLKSLHNKREDNFYKTAKIRTLVKNNLVKYHHLPNINRFILSENPEFGYKRHLYLRQIIGYRARGKNIIYVIVIKLESVERRPSFIVLAATPNAGLIAKSDQMNYAGDADDQNGNDQVKLWIRNTLLPQMSTSAVIVLMQPWKKDITPTPFSSKTEMVNWLQKNQIPCDEQDHNGNLYSLVTAFKSKDQGMYEEVLASGGFKVLVCPTEYQSLDFFNFHEICTTGTGNIPLLLEKLLVKLTREEWNVIERKLIDEEMKMMADDEEMEKIVGNLLQMAKDGVLVEEDFPDGCGGTKAEDFSVHIGDIIVD